jgi:glucose dehydrogenase
MAERTFGMRHALVIAIAVSILSLHGGAADRTEEWRFYGGDQGAKRYSPLEQINKGLVSRICG